MKAYFIMGNLLNFKYIVTHPGQFHADDLLAAALLRQASGFPDVYRRVPTQEEMDDPFVAVVDIGGEHDPNRSNYDHHHDPELPAACELVLRDLVRAQKLRMRLQPIKAYETENRDWASHGPLQELSQAVSNVDIGLLSDNVGLNAMIRQFNSQDPVRALQWMDRLVEAYIASHTERKTSQKIWEETNKVEVFGKKSRMTEHNRPIVGWKEMAEAEGVVYLVTPNARGGWQVLSRDTEVAEVPPCKGQTFRHNARFIAVWPTLDDLNEEGDLTSRM